MRSDEELREANRQYTRNYYKHMRKEHRCVKCGKELPQDYFYVACMDCKFKQKVRECK